MEADRENHLLILFCSLLYAKIIELAKICQINSRMSKGSQGEKERERVALLPMSFCPLFPLLSRPRGARALNPRHRNCWHSREGGGGANGIAVEVLITASYELRGAALIFAKLCN